MLGRAASAACSGRCFCFCRSVWLWFWFGFSPIQMAPPLCGLLRLKPCRFNVFGAVYGLAAALAVRMRVMCK